MLGVSRETGDVPPADLTSVATDAEAVEEVSTVGGGERETTEREGDSVAPTAAGRHDEAVAGTDDVEGVRPSEGPEGAAHSDGPHDGSAGLTVDVHREGVDPVDGASLATQARAGSGAAELAGPDATTVSDDGAQSVGPGKADVEARLDGRPDSVPPEEAVVAPAPVVGPAHATEEVTQPVDSVVDERRVNGPSERESSLGTAGDNVVDERAEQPRFGAATVDRDALAAAVPVTDGETPLAHELAENTRRRIQLFGRAFPKPSSPRVLTVANQKGGVGKTTTTVNVAAALAQSGLQALVIDLDPQGNASTALGIDHHAEVPSIYDVLVDGVPLLDVVQPCTTVENLYCAPATIDLAGAEIELVSLVARESRLQKAIRAATEAGHPYDYILIDCPPSLGLLTVNAMVAASEVFIPIQCEYYALEGLSQLLKNIELVKAHLNPPLHVSTILLTMYDGRTRLSAQVAEEVREHFPEQVLRTTVPRSVRVSEAPSFGETVMTYDPTSSGALAYLEAAGEIADRGAAGRV